MTTTNWERTADLLVRGGRVVDGSGAPTYAADVRIRGSVVAEVAENLRPDGEPELDAVGCYVSPGFIDAHTHFDASVFWDPFCDPMPQHGVTTVLTGNCSLSLAPMRTVDRKRQAEIFSYIEDMSAAMFSEGFPWTWTTYLGYLEALRGLGPGINIGSFVGHDEDAAKRPVPSRLADEAELTALLAVLGRYGRILTFIPDVSHHAAMVTDVERVASLCRTCDVTATWNGLFHDERKPKRSAEALEQAARLQAGGARIYPQVSPRSLDFRVNWDGGMSFYSLAPWHRVVQAQGAEKRRLLADLALEAAVRALTRSPSRASWPPPPWSDRTGRCRRPDRLRSRRAVLGPRSPPARPAPGGGAASSTTGRLPSHRGRRRYRAAGRPAHRPKGWRRP